MRKWLANFFGKMLNIFRGKRDVQMEAPPQSTETQEPKRRMKYAGCKMKTCLNCNQSSPTHTGTKQICTYCGSKRYRVRKAA